MKLILVVASLFLSGTVFAQTANVIELSATDTAKAQKAWDVLQKAQAEWNGLQEEIKQKYTFNTSQKDDPNCLGATVNGKYYGCPKKGFENGFEFSKDFRFIVPKAAEPRATRISPCIGIGCDVTW